MNSLQNSTFTITKASLEKTNLFFLELARLVLRQNKSVFSRIILVSLKSGVLQGVL